MPSTVMTRTSTVWATVRLPGFHRWPLAHAGREYLADRHRHLFGLRAEVSVSHSDRDVEFHDLADDLRLWWGPSPARECGVRSCEDLAHQLGQYLTDKGYRVVAVTVDEDGECGATALYAYEES